MGQGGSKPEDIVAIAQQSVDYKPPLGPANPVSEQHGGFRTIDTEMCVGRCGWQRWKLAAVAVLCRSAALLSRVPFLLRCSHLLLMFPFPVYTSCQYC